MAPVRTVSTAGVNFRDQDEVKAFYGKLHMAVHAVCRAYSGSPLITQSDRACMARAMAEAVQRADRPMLTAEYQAHTNRTATAYANR